MDLKEKGRWNYESDGRVFSFSFFPFSLAGSIRALFFGFGTGLGSRSHDIFGLCFSVYPFR